MNDSIVNKTRECFQQDLKASQAKHTSLYTVNYILAYKKPIGYTVQLDWL